MNSYKVLNNQIFTEGEFAIVPIRFEDRFDILKWRNEQIYHLRQEKLLTEENQENYFNTVVSRLFDQEKPSQILFSFLKNDRCIGYGGLVHIKWVDQNAEISFLMDTSLENEFFEKLWVKFLSLIEMVAFVELGFHKIFTYAFDVRPRLYSALIEKNFIHEATLKQHCQFNRKFIDVLIHSKINSLHLREANRDDIDITFKWATNPEIRKYSFNQNTITIEEHKNWFNGKIDNERCEYLILSDTMLNNLGSIRIDLDENGSGVISYLIDPVYHGRGYGKKILELLEIYVVENNIRINNLIGFVMFENIASIKIFEAFNYEKYPEDGSFKFIKKIQ